MSDYTLFSYIVAVVLVAVAIVLYYWRELRRRERVREEVGRWTADMRRKLQERTPTKETKEEIADEADDYEMRRFDSYRRELERDPDWPCRHLVQQEFDKLLPRVMRRMERLQRENAELQARLLDALREGL